MPNIDLTKAPNKFNLAYGKNIISLYDLDPSSTITRFNLIIKDTIGATISQVKQIPNISGYAHFDIENILKNQVSHNPAIETTPKLTTADYENFSYTIDYGYDNSATYSAATFSVLNGRKTYTEIDWDYNEYIPTVGGFTIVFGPTYVLYFDINTYCKALTDRHLEYKNYGSITDGKPNWTLQSTTKVWYIDKYVEDHYTLTWLNDFNLTTNPQYTDIHPFTTGINGFRIAIYNSSNTLLADDEIENLTTNGGGPDTATGDFIIPSGEYNAITLQASQLNSIIASYPTAAYFYVAPFYWYRDPDTSTSKTIVGELYRFNVVDSECDDDNHIQVSWVNSFGFRDYFTFTKKNDYRIKTKQDTYHQLDADWSGPTIEVNSYNRGERVFNKSQEVEYTATTKLLTDNEAEYLKNLYLSPDVKVRFAGDTNWTPVILTDSEYTQRRYRYDKAFQFTINFKLANKNQIQRG